MTRKLIESIKNILKVKSKRNTIDIRIEEEMMMDMERPTSLVAKKSLFKGNVTNIQHDKNKFWWYNQMYSTYVGQIYDINKGITSLEFNLNNYFSRKWISDLFKHNHTNADTLEIKGIYSSFGELKMRLLSWGAIDYYIKCPDHKGMKFIDNYDQINMIRDMKVEQKEIVNKVRDNFIVLLHMAEKDRLDNHLIVNLKNKTIW
mgnify:FL=1